MVEVFIVNYLSWLTLGTTFLLATTPSLAASQKITAIDFAENRQGMELKLTLDGKDSAESSFVSVDQGKTIETTILNSKLNLANQEVFQKSNPFPGISKVTLKQIDENQTKVTLVKDENLTFEPTIIQSGSELNIQFNQEKIGNSIFEKVPFSSDLIQLKNNLISFTDSQRNKDSKKTRIPTTRTQKTKKGRDSNLLVSEPQIIETKNSQDSDILVPDPEIVVSENPQNLLNAHKRKRSGHKRVEGESSSLPRAIAPPVGDIAVSNISTFPDSVDLNSNAVVPRLVLRDAPVREVLSLLARQAGLNIVFSTGGDGEDSESTSEGPTVSLDLENQSVQEAFDSILLISNLNASRRENIIYVGKELPAQARNLISRTIRLNQVEAENAALFLASQGAQGQRLTTEVEEIVDPETDRVVGRRELPATLEDLGGAVNDEENSTSALLLRGVQVATDDRLNSITLVGEARKVEMATAFLTQLDARRRQVAVNVKIVDINLSNQDIFNSSFSFGVNDSFFVQDNGAATLRFGDTDPINDLNIGTPGGTGLINNPRQFLALLESSVVSGNAKILTDPTIVVQEGQESTIKLTQDIITNVTTNISDNGVTTTEAELGEAGLTVNVNVERIDDNGFVLLSVSPTVSSIGDSVIFDSGSADNTINLLSRREVSSGLIRLRDGQTLILSGIIQDQELSTVTKVPVLGDIPLLGSLFRSTDKTNERAEVIVLLTPEIIDEQADFGYNYRPSKESRELLKKGGSDLPNEPK